MNVIKMFSELTGKPHTQAQKILEDLGGIYNIATLDESILAQHPKLTKKQARRLWAGFQLGRSSVLKRPTSNCITSPQEAYEEIQRFLLGKQEEALVALYLNRRRAILHARCLTQGSEAYTIVDPRQIFHYAIQCRASGVILAHNHPSGDPTPSSQDIEVTKKTAHIGTILQIPLLDHLVVTSNSYTSLAALGVI